VRLDRANLVVLLRCCEISHGVNYPRRAGGRSDLGGSAVSQSSAAALLFKKHFLLSRRGILTESIRGKLRASRAASFQLSEGELEVTPVVSSGAAAGYSFWSGTFGSRSAVMVGIALFAASSAHDAHQTIFLVSALVHERGRCDCRARLLSCQKVQKPEPGFQSGPGDSVDAG